MAAAIHAKKLKGKKVWYVYGADGNSKWERLYPDCQSRSDLYDVLRAELGLPRTSNTKDVAFSLFNMTWSGDRWQSDFSRRLRRLREKAGATQAALAEKAGLSVQAISALEGDTRSPSWETVRRLAFALGVDEKEFTDAIPKDAILRAMKELV